MPAERALSPEAQRVLDAREAAIQELKLIDGQDRPINDHLVLRLAGARMYADNINLRVISGEAVSATEVQTAQEMIEQARDAIPKPPIKVEVAFVDGIVGICPKCHAHIEDYVAPPKPKVPPPVIDSEVLKPEPKALPSPTDPKLAAPPERKHPGSIHNQPGVPLKRYDEPWRTYGRTC